MELLRVIGFNVVTLDDDRVQYLILSNRSNDDNVLSKHTMKMFEEALNLLSLLQSRLDENFIPDISPPTLWEQPIPLHNNSISSTTPSSLSSSHWSSATHFVSDDERWTREERNRRRRGGDRPYRPGNTPSSYGA